MHVIKTHFMKSKKDMSIQKTENKFHLSKKSNNAFQFKIKGCFLLFF